MPQGADTVASMVHFKRNLALAAVAALLLGLTTPSGAAASPQSSNPGTLFAVGAPNEDVGSVGNAGLVVLMRSDASGLPDPSTAAHIFQGASGTAGVPEIDDYFGAAVAVGDFNNDNYSDVAIGAPGEDIGPDVNTGLIHIMYGGVTGTIGGAKDAIHQDTPGVPGSNEDGDFFGRELVVLDFNGDGIDDLAISAPLEDVGSIDSAGAVTVLYGNSQGPNKGASGSYYHQGLSSVPGGAEPGDQFGASLGGTDGRLVVGAPRENLGTVVEGGAIFVIDFGGTIRGLTQDSPGIIGGAEEKDVFGLAVAAEGDTVFVGAPGEDSGSIISNGVVHALHVPRSANGAVTDKLISQDSPGVTSLAEDYDYFGANLTTKMVGNIIHVGIGSPFESTGATLDAGMVHILAYNPSTKAVSQVGAWTQASPGVPAASEEGDTFGNEVWFSANGTMLVGVDHEDIGAPKYEGNTPTGKTDSGGFLGINLNGAWRFVNQDSAGVPGSAEAGDTFGFSLG